MGLIKSLLSGVAIVTIIFSLAQILELQSFSWFVTLFPTLDAIKLMGISVFALAVNTLFGD